ncbi:uncharacterized protein LOC143023587 [Oratosquilla oratoria]|uniref:uncharacterized protein LOC143023587 n=1 Tax=Oratosquilla oratoria TaxID=337810 RepID=UPI003F758240
MEELLSDTRTYNKQRDGTAKKEAEYFNKSTRNILKRTEKGKKLFHLLEENPKVPSMKGLPKIHKPEIPLRPITSGIGSAPHKLAKILAKPLSSALGSISSTNLRNSADLIEKLDDVDFSEKRLVSYDITSLFTNVSVTGAISAIKESLKTIDDDKLPVCKRDYMQLVEKCIRFRSFRFKDQEYHLLDGLPMGSPLSAVAASLYLEMLERDHYLKIIPKDAHWFRYVDDCLLIFPAENNTSDIMSKLNEVVDNIQFTMENESLGRLPFLDTEIHRSSSELLETSRDPRRPYVGSQGLRRNKEIVKYRGGQEMFKHKRRRRCPRYATLAVTIPGGS